MLQTDSEIVAALRESDQGVFEKLFRHFYNPLCRFAENILNDGDEAEEVVQQVMITIWEKRQVMEINISLKSYLYRSVHNGALNKIRQAKLRVVHAHEQLAAEVVTSPPASGRIMNTELETEVQKAISKLPEQCRIVFKLSRFEGMKYAEIAQHLDISVKTVENHMGKALKLMREYLKDYLVLIFAFLPWLL